MEQDTERSDALSRRKYLGALVAGTAAVAGCAGGGSDGSSDGGSDGSSDGESDGSSTSSDGGSGDGGSSNNSLVGEPGERVPTLVAKYWANTGAYTAQAESYMPIIQQNLSDIGMEFRASPSTSSIGEIINDQRTMHFNQWSATMTPERLDPDPQTFRWHAGWAGANGRGNAVNYASCEYTEYAFAQRQALTEEERREAVESAHQTWAGDVGYIPMYPDPKFGAYWDDQVDAGGVGDIGVLEINSNFKIKSASASGETVTANTGPAVVETITYPTNTSTSALAVWNNCVMSPLMGYNEQQELVPVLAEDYTVEDEATTFTFTLRDGTFHNGDPITAEDVKWSYSYFNENADFFPKGSRSPYESIEVVDEKTVTFNTTKPFRPLLGRTLPRWGVLPKAMQDVVEEDPSNWGISGEEMIGSGPYKIRSFQQGASLQLEPHDGHPVWQPESNYLLISYDSVQGAFRAFENQEIDILTNAASGVVSQLEDLDGATMVPTDGLMEAGLAPQMSFGPTKHREFRLAVSQAIDRETIVETAVDGRSEPNVKATIWSEYHPWQNVEDLPPIADSTSANPEAARQVLEENGYTWDDQDRLHYPEDIDLSPAWPDGSEPAEHPDDFPCIEEFGIEPASS